MSAIFNQFFAAGALRAFKAVSASPGFAGMTHRVVAGSLSAAAFDANILFVVRGGLLTQPTEQQVGIPIATTPIQPSPLSFFDPVSGLAGNNPSLLTPADAYLECFGQIVSGTAVASGPTPDELLGYYNALRTAPYSASPEVTVNMAISGPLTNNSVWIALLRQHPAMAFFLSVNLADATWLDPASPGG
jgi:hypothetical protein